MQLHRNIIEMRTYVGTCSVPGADVGQLDGGGLSQQIRGHTISPSLPSEFRYSNIISDFSDTPGRSGCSAVASQVVEYWLSGELQILDSHSLIFCLRSCELLTLKG